jgi:predicted metal-dependent HD superfamily phosphohydrolase
MIILKVPEDISLNWFGQVRDLYSQSWRKYHNLNHLYHFVSQADQLFTEQKIKNYVNTLLAIWFHDIIYIPSRKDNEDRSCEIFMQFFQDIKGALILENIFESVDTETILNYIMCTKSHFEDNEYDDTDLNYMLDLDLLTFSLPYEKFIENNKGIHFEFTHHLSEEQFKNGRGNFLKMVLKKKQIYRTPEMYEKYEKLARENIQRDLNENFN